ncbi:uncharacterized protein B0H18DRAFT_1123290 [Fomitopsis serialis]|uniref:uncharacterized protein n=1 Tax=Fomitopsis serialis TaxID=139415 RepID=UPI0020081ABE|nr:uncharacterized protein B0H18DRAFT_1123290 [Neoantrodia serialis]KAH9918019.1 hypothetical protein B0H18DRAFT_1123290 [Neoantrodia serialis]
MADKEEVLDGSEPYEPSALYRPYLVPQNKDYEDIRRIYSEGLNASVAFLTLPRSNKETDDLDAFLSSCLCSFSPAKNATEARLLLWLHAFEAARRLILRDLTEAFIRHLGGVLNHAVESRTVGGTTAMGGLSKHRNKHAGKPLWPTDPSQLIPYGLQQDKAAYHPGILHQHAVMLTSIEDPLSSAFDGFGWASRARHCCAPECGETFATAGRAFARCSGCSVLRYCSRPCQSRAWKHATVPHKDVCMKLRVLRERTHLPQDRELKRERDRQAFVEACSADGELAMFAQDWGMHWHELTHTRRNHGGGFKLDEYRVWEISPATGLGVQIAGSS